MRALSISFATFVLAGCYTYQPLQEPSPAVGSRISAEITPPGAMQLAPAMGVAAQDIRGQVVAADPDAIRVAITSVTSFRGDLQSWRGEQVSLPKISLAGVSQRHFSMGRSLTLAAGFIGGAVLSWEAFRGGRRSNGSQTGGTGGPGNN